MSDSSGFIASVRSRVNLVSLIGRYTKVWQEGDLYVCCSPLRVEKTASFKIYPDGKYWDYGTDTGGDCFTFMMQKENLTFAEALYRLAEDCGIEVPRRNGVAMSHEDMVEEIERHSVFDMLTQAAHHYHFILPTKMRNEFYYRQYGFNDETIDRFKLGWSDGSLYEYFSGKLKYSKANCLKTGLFVETSNGVVDAFQDRLIFPYWVAGECRYMIGRKTIYTSDNSYERAKYKKLKVHSERRKTVSHFISNNVFYNEGDGRIKTKRLIITEGVADCISAIQHGFKCISPVTRQFRKKDIPALIEAAKNADEIIICNDNDVLPDGRKPGEEGALNTAEALHRARRNVRIAEIPRLEGTKIDLCDYLRLYGADAAKKVFDEAKTLIQWKMDRLLEETKEPSEPQIQELVRIVAHESELTRSRTLDIIAKRMKLAKKPLKAKLAEELVAMESFQEPPPLDVSGTILPPPHPDGESPTATGDAATALALAPSLLPSSGPVALEGTWEGAGPSSAPPSGGGGGGSSAPPRSKKRWGNGSDDNGTSVAGHVIVTDRGYGISQLDGSVLNISNFVLRPIKATMGDVEQIVCELVVFDDETRDPIAKMETAMPKSAFYGKRELIRSIPTMRARFCGTDQNAQFIGQMLANNRQVARVMASDKAGLHASSKGAFWISERTNLSSNPDVKMEYVTQASRHIGKSLYYGEDGEDLTTEQINECFQDMFRILPAEHVGILIGWFFASFVKPFIMEEVGTFPILLLHGQYSSGKTSIIRNVFWRLCGVPTSQNPYSCTDTLLPIAKALSSSTSIPIFFDEYKPSDMHVRRSDDFQRMLRRVYGGEDESRGRQDMTELTMSLSAPVVVSGEEEPADHALRERMIMVSPDKTKFTVESSEALKRLRTAPLHVIGGKIARWVVQNYKDLKRIFTESYTYHHRTINNNELSCGGRVSDNIMAITFGLHIASEFLESIGLQLNRFSISDIYRMVVSGATDGLMSRSKTDLDRFMEAMGVMIAGGNLLYGTHYIVKGDMLCFPFKLCFAEYLKHVRHTKPLVEGTVWAAVSESIKTKGYVLGKKNHSYSGKVLYSVEIDQTKIPESILFDKVERGTADKRPWTSN